MVLNALFSPFSIGTLEMHNRIVMPPMATNYGTSEGIPTERQIAYYVERARGGVGYITVEHAGILQQGKRHPNMILISSDEHATGIEKLVEAVHRVGGKIVIQINHAGRQASSAVTGFPIVGPSPIPCLKGGEIPRELSTAEIEDITEAFALAARRVKNAGADGVELHMAHGYLICSFLSSFSNRRNDEYGGDVQGRSRFAVAVLNSVRTSVGSDFPIICRLSGDEYVDGGLRIDETKQIATILEKEGADALNISACNHVSSHLLQPSYYVEEGIFVHLAQAIKSVAGLPVITVGRIRNPIMADQILRDGKADLVSMGRALIADPHLPNKAKEGRLDEINYCMSCNRCIQTQRKGELRCAVNPEAGKEHQSRLSKTNMPKRIWIVGGGPAGLKAAEIATLRGHRVTLFEKDHKLGGRLGLAAVPPQKDIWNDFLNYLEKRVKGVGVTLELGKEFTANMLEADKPDAVIVASGARPLIPDWKGINESGALLVDDVLSGKGNVGKRVLVIGGGGIGAELADYLSEMGKEVTLVEMLEEIAADLVIHLKHYLSQRLAEKRVSILTSTKVKELGKGYALVEDASGTRKIEGFDTIVLAVGSKSDNHLTRKLEGKVPELYVIGDASDPREALEAVYEGEEVALRI